MREWDDFGYFQGRVSPQMAFYLLLSSLQSRRRCESPSCSACGVTITRLDDYYFRLPKMARNSKAPELFRERGQHASVGWDGRIQHKTNAEQAEDQRVI